MYIFGFMPLGSNSQSPLGPFKTVLGLGIPTNLHLPRLVLGGGHTQMILYIYVYFKLFRSNLDLKNGIFV